MEIFSDFIEFQHIKYFCSKCMCEFLVEIRNKNYNVEVKCLGWIDGLIFMVTEEAKEQLMKEQK